MIFKASSLYLKGDYSEGYQVAQFLDPLMYVRTGKRSNGRPVFRLIERFRFDYGETEAGHHIIFVSSGFETDLASTPRVVWVFCPPWIGEEAAVIHDWIYRKGELNRRVADAIYYQALQVMGVVWLLRILMWLSVRIFGRSSYKRMSVEDTFSRHDTSITDRGDS